MMHRGTERGNMKTRGKGHQYDKPLKSDDDDEIAFKSLYDWKTLQTSSKWCHKR